MATTKLKLLPRSTIKARSLTRFPANVVGTDGVSVTQDGATYTFRANISSLIGNTIQAHDNDLDAIAALTGTGLLQRLGEGDWELSGNGTRGQVYTSGASTPSFLAGELNIKAYGAVANGGAGDAATNSTALQSALNDTAFGTIYIPGGEYYINGQILGVSNKRLRGDPGLTILKLANAPANGVDWFYWSSVTTVELDGIIFDADSKLTDFSNGHFPNLRPIMYFVGGHDITVKNCKFLNWDTTAFLTNTAYNVAVLNNVIDRGSPSAGHLTGGTSRTDGAITAGAASFTSAGANFLIGDVNKMIVIEGAGTAGGPLTALISARVSATNVTLNRNAITTVSGASFQYGGTQVSVTGIELVGTGVVDGNELRYFRVEGNRVIYGSIGVSGHDGVIARNIISGHSFGAAIHSQSLASNFNLTITDNVIFSGNPSQDTAGAYPGGIESWAANSAVANNVINTCAGPGISIGGRTDVLGNVCWNNGQANLFLTIAGGFAGIGMFAQDATFQPTGSFVSGNRSFDTQASKTQQYGYFEHANVAIYADDIVLGLNKFSGNLTSNVLLQSLTNRTSTMATTTTIAAGGFSGGTFASPSITGANPLTLLNVGAGAFNLQLRPNTTMTGNRILNLAMDVDRTITLGGDISIGNSLTTAAAFVVTGGHTLQFTTVGGTTLTLPTSGTLVAGPGSSTNKAAVRFSGTGGTTLQDSAFNIADTNGEPTYTGAAWSTYTATVTAAVGTFTAASGAVRYRQQGKTLEMVAVITITTVGTGSFPNFTLPVAASQAFIGVAQNSSVGTMWTAVSASGASSVTMRRYDNSGTVGSGDVLIASITYEVA